MNEELTTSLPRIDTHGFRTAASPDRVRAALAATLLRSFGSRRARLLARLLGCADRAPSRPFRLEPGARVAGFRVVSVDDEAVALAGRHRFARYAVIFSIGESLGGTAVNAETRAAFPGTLGRIYRAAVIGTGAHVAAMKRILRHLKRRSEQASRA